MLCGAAKKEKRLSGLELCELFRVQLEFPHSSVGKESACNAEDPGSNSELGRSAEEGIGYPLQCSWASSLVAQLVKNPPAMQKTPVQCLGWEDSLEKAKPSHFSIMTLRIPWTIQMGIPDHLTCLLRNLYAGQKATVRTGHGTTDWFQIGKGVYQGCILLPCLFKLYAEYIM